MVGYSRSKINAEILPFGDSSFPDVVSGEQMVGDA